MIQDKIFDRENYLEILRKRIRDLKLGYRQNMAIVGGELVGKTSIIFKLLRRFSDPYLIILYLEIRPESWASFSRRYIGVLLYNFLLNSEHSLPEDLDFLIRRSEKYVPKTVAKIRTILANSGKSKSGKLFTELLSLCDSIYQESGKSTVVIFDEFHNLEKLGVKNLYSEWTKVLVSQKNTLFIIISSLQYKSKSILSKNLSLLFGNFEIITIEPFNIKESEAYLEASFKEAGGALDAGTRSFMVNFTGGYPFYLEVISREFIKSGCDSLADTLKNLLLEPSGTLNLRFSNYLRRFLDLPGSQNYLSVMHTVAKGHNKIKDIAHILHKPKKEVLSYLNCLLEADFLSRSADFLSLSDRVFSFWLKFVYQGKFQSLTFDAKSQKEQFNAEVQKMINEFLKVSQKPLMLRLQELLGLFSDDTIEIEKKKIKLTHFREVKRLEFKRQGIKNGLIGRSNEALWILALKDSSLTEEDVAGFAKECKRYRHRLQRKIIVTREEICANARLRALDEKILTWNLNDINYIMDMFYRPRIIA